MTKRQAIGPKPDTSSDIMDKPNIAQFAQEVRQEAAKVTWPTRRETAISTAMVFVMVIVAALDRKSVV